jgi:FKBP12-rapamycin complex-associated protein
VSIAILRTSMQFFFQIDLFFGGAAVAMDGLVDVECEESSTFITRFANYLRQLLPCNDVATMIMASKVLGHLAQAGGTLTADFVEFEVKRALEGLNSEKRVEQQRLASVLVLKELAINAPTLFYMHMAAFLKSIWAGVRDPKQMIREAAIENLRACLALISEREGAVKTKWYLEVFEECQRGLRSTQTETLHGALLTTGELLRINIGILSRERVAELYDLVINQKGHKDSLIRRTVINLLPTLARFDEDEFCAKYLRESISHLITILRKGSERSSPYLALGSIVQVAGNEVRPWMADIMSLIEDGIMPKNRKPHCYEAMTCLACVSSALPDDPFLQSRIPGLLEQMFAGTEGRLDPRMVSALSDLAASIPTLLPEIQLRLLDSISFILQRTPYQPSGTPKSRRIAPLRATGGVDDGHDRQQAAIQALQALAKFDFEGTQLLEFVRDCVATYLDDNNPEVRLEAARTCSKLLLPPGQAIPKRGHSAGVVCRVLETLLVVSVSDPESHIRLSVLNSLDARFDYFLSQADCISSLFVALNDEVFEIREAAVQIIGRLTLRNPAHVMPSMRKMLVQLLTALEFGAEGSREQSARLFGHVILACHHLIKPYVAPVLQAVLPKLKDPNPNVAANVLKTIGVLSRVGSQEVLKRRDEIFPMVIEALQDQSSSMKREVSLRTLGVLVQSTGYVIEPFERYPELLSVMSTRLQAETSSKIRTEYIKVIGILGAVDPHRLKMLDMSNKSSLSSTALITDTKNRNTARVTTTEAESLPGPSSEEYYPSVAITQLMKILNDQSLSSHHMMVIQAVLFVFRTLGLKCVSLLPQIVPPMLALVKTSQQGLRDFLFQQLSILVAIVKQHIRPYLPQTFALVHEFWNQTALQPQMLTMIEEITIALKDEFKTYIPDLIPKLLGILNMSFVHRSPVTCLKVLRVLELFDANLEQYLHITIPAIVKLAEQPDAKMEVRVGAIMWIRQMSRKLDFTEFASRLIHPLARMLDTGVEALRVPTMKALCALMHALGRKFIMYEPMLAKVIARRKIIYVPYETGLSHLQAGEALPPEDGGQEDGGGAETPTEEQVPIDGGVVKKIAVNQQNLKRAWEASHRSTREDWADWMRRFSVELLRESPSPALRSCAALAQVFHPLARELFNAAFVSCWGELYDQYRDSLMRALETALSDEKSPNIPPEVLQTLLTLAEFMEHDEKPLPINIRKLGSVAEKCQAYAKALHYKELEFLSSPTTCIQSLISINNLLGLPEAANGMLAHAQKTLKVELKESWYEKLRRWEDALDAYQRRLDDSDIDAPQRTEATEGCMRCLSALGEWERLNSLAEKSWVAVDEVSRKRMAPMAAHASWHLGKFDCMRDYVTYMDARTADGSFCRSLLLVIENRFDDAKNMLGTTRSQLYTEITALVGESFERAYKAIVKAQQVAELEEVIMYKQSFRPDDPQQRQHIRNMWNARLNGIQCNVEVWQSVLAVHSLVIPPHENVQGWLKFASHCRKSKRFNLSERVLLKLIGGPQQVGPHMFATVDPSVTLAWFKHLWAVGEKNQAMQGMQAFARAGNGSHSVMARSHLKLGEWVWSVGENNVDEVLIKRVLGSMRSATHHDNSWAKAWHKWALFNFEVITYYEMRDNRAAINPYLQPAVSGFFRSISLRRCVHGRHGVLVCCSLYVCRLVGMHMCVCV